MMFINIRFSPASLSLGWKKGTLVFRSLTQSSYKDITKQHPIITGSKQLRKLLQVLKIYPFDIFIF